MGLQEKMSILTNKGVVILYQSKEKISMVTNKPVSTSKSTPSPAPAKKAATPAGKDGSNFLNILDQRITMPTQGKIDEMKKNAVRDTKNNA